MSDYGFVFVLSRIDVTSDTPYEIIPLHYLRKARKEEIQLIKRSIDLSRGTPISVYQYERTGQKKLINQVEVIQSALIHYQRRIGHIGLYLLQAITIKLKTYVMPVH